MWPPRGRGQPGHAVTAVASDLHNSKCREQGRFLKREPPRSLLGRRLLFYRGGKI